MTTSTNGQGAPARYGDAPPPAAPTVPRWFSRTVAYCGGFLVIGGLTSAVLNVVVPQSWLQAVADRPVISVVALAVLAVVLSICSEADAFVAASLGQFSLTARLAFLVVGPMVDIKLFALQAGTFGRAFASRFAPTTFVVGVVVASLVGWWLL